MSLLHVWVSYVMLIIAMIYSWVDLLIAFFSPWYLALKLWALWESMLREENSSQLIRLPGSNEALEHLLCIDISIIHTHICLCSIYVSCATWLHAHVNMCVYGDTTLASAVFYFCSLSYSLRKSLLWNPNLTDYLDWQASESQRFLPVPELQILVTMVGFYEA